MKLVVPSVEYKDSYLEALEEGKDETQITIPPKPSEDQSFEDFVQKLVNHSQGMDLPQGYVPATTFWLVDNNEFIGWVNIRHELTDHLRKLGGHIGYYIRVSKRGKGYGTKILELGLQKAKELGIKDILITCDPNNKPSKKIIEINGGVYQDTIDNPTHKTNRYWIKLP